MIKFCPQCGYELPALSKFCPECGKRIKQKKSKIKQGYCPDCGTKSNPKKQFCEHCGISFCLIDPVDCPPKTEKPIQIIHSNKKPDNQAPKKSIFGKKVKTIVIMGIILVGIIFSAQSFGLINIYGYNNENFIGTWQLQDHSWVKINDINGSIDDDLITKIDASIPGNEIIFKEDGTCIMDSKSKRYEIQKDNILTINPTKAENNYFYDFIGHENNTLLLSFTITGRNLLTYTYYKNN